MGYRVLLTRSSDVFVPLKRRVYFANKANCELFVSLHFNSCSTQIVKGIEIYYHSSSNYKRSRASRGLANSVLSQMIKKTAAKSRGVKRGNFCVIRETKMPSILIEGGFMTNPQEMNNLRQQIYLEKLARAVAEGIDSFVKS